MGVGGGVGVGGGAYFLFVAFDSYSFSDEDYLFLNKLVVT